MPRQRPRSTAGVLRLPGRVLEALEDHQSDRKQFATVRRTIRSKGRLSNKTALAMVFKLVEAAQRAWRRLDGCNQLPKLILGVKFADRLEVAKDIYLGEILPH